MSSTREPQEGFTLMDVLPIFTLIASPVTGLIGARHHGLSGMVLGLACGFLIGVAGFAVSRGLISGIWALVGQYSDEAPGPDERCGCAAQIAVLGLLLLLTVIPLCSTQIASHVVGWLFRG